MALYITGDTIQFLYGEAPTTSTQKIENFLPEDELLHEELEDLKYVAEALEELLESPRPQSVMAILNYAKRSASVA